MQNIESLNTELRKAGLETQFFMNKELSPVEILVNTKTSAKPYKDILLKYIEALTGKELEMLIRALSEKGISNVSSRLISFFENKIDYPNLDLWVVGNALSIIDDKTSYQEILKLCQNKEFGNSRQMMMTTLRKIGTEESFKTLIDSLQDETIRGHAIDELRKLGDPRALKPIENTEVRKGLFEEKAKKKALEKLITAANNLE